MARVSVMSVMIDDVGESCSQQLSKKVVLSIVMR